METKIDQVGENKKELAGALAAKVMALAESRYEEGGWDVIAECWTLEEISEHLLEFDLLTEHEAVESFSRTASVFADRQADADYHRRQAG